jgi:hypothetical protein
MGDGYADNSPVPPTEAATNWQSQILAATAYLDWGENVDFHEEKV